MVRFESRIHLQYLTIFVLFPPVYVAYSTLVAEGATVEEYRLVVSPQRMVVIGLVLAEIGVVAVALWRRKIRLAPLLALAGLLSIPFLYTAAPGSSVVEGPLFVVYTSFVTLAAVEYGIKNSSEIRNILSKKCVQYAAVVGVAHSGLAVMLQVASRSVSSLVLLPLLATPLFAILFFALTTVAVVLWVQSKAYSPLLVVTGWATLGVYETVTLERRADFFQGISWFSPSPSPDYLLSIGILTAFVVLLFLIEDILRETRTRE